MAEKKKNSFEANWKLHRTREYQENAKKAKEAIEKIIEMGTDRK